MLFLNEAMEGCPEVVYDVDPLLQELRVLWLRNRLLFCTNLCVGFARARFPADEPTPQQLWLDLSPAYWMDVQASSAILAQDGVD